MTGMEIAAVAMMAAGAVATAAGTLQQGAAEQDAAKYQARVAKNNAILANRSAADAADRGAIAEQKQRAQGRLILGHQRAAFAANNVNLSSETAVDLQASQGGLNELDALTVRANAQREAMGYQTEAMNEQSQALALKAQGSNASYFSKAGAGATLLTGSAAVADKWYQYKNPNSASTGSSYGGNSYSSYYHMGTN